MIKVPKKCDACGYYSCDYESEKQSICNKCYKKANIEYNELFEDDLKDLDDE